MRLEALRLPILAWVTWVSNRRADRRPPKMVLKRNMLVSTSERIWYPELSFQAFRPCWRMALKFSSRFSRSAFILPCCQIRAFFLGGIKRMAAGA